MLAEHCWGLLLLQSPKTDPEPCAMKHQGLFPGRVIPKIPHINPIQTQNIPVICRNTHTHKIYHLVWNSLCSELDANEPGSTNCWDVNEAHTEAGLAELGSPAACQMSQPCSLPCQAALTRLGML